MEIRRAARGDLRHFRELAHGEGWRVPCNEIDLYHREMAGCAFVLCREEQRLGFVTAVDYGRSGWIGNLLVPPEYRGRGYGAKLFRHALDVLRFRRVSSFWLAASASGGPLYRRHGFRTLGRIDRWIYEGAGESYAPDGPGEKADVIHRLDADIWGEPRRRLLDPFCRRGRILQSGSTAALLQEGETMQVLGPWISPAACPRENRQVLAAAVNACGRDRELVIDVLTSSPCSALPLAAGFSHGGENELMVLGSPETVRLDSLVAFASLGSLG